jgi:hypothetical protein
MPSSTPVYGFPYRLLADSPDIPTATKDLAEAIEAKIQAMDAILNAQIATRFKGTNAPGGTQTIGTVETILTETVTFTAVSARQYLCIHTDQFSIASGSPTGQTYRFRYASGASLTTAGTLIQQFEGPAPLGGHQSMTRHTVFVAPSSGQFTVGVGYFTNGGATVNHTGGSRRFTVIDIA